MTIITLTEANLLDEMTHGEGWKVLEKITTSILGEMQKKVMERNTTPEQREAIMLEYYHLKDFMKLPERNILRLVSHEKTKDAKKKNYDSYHTVESLRELEGKES